METNQAASKFQDTSIAPMHTAEHLLNATMVKMYGCPRSKNAHIEKKKSKCDYILATCPSDAEIQAVEDKMNETIRRNLPVTIEFMLHQQAEEVADLSKLPEEAENEESLRMVRIGDYDICACIGLHVENTSELGTFKIISHDYDADRNTLRLRYKLIKNN